MQSSRMESDDLFLLAIDTLLGGPDEPRARPGLELHDFQQLGRMLFWPALLSVVLVCWALVQGLAAS